MWGGGVTGAVSHREVRGGFFFGSYKTGGPPAQPPGGNGRANKAKFGLPASDRRFRPVKLGKPPIEFRKTCHETARQDRFPRLRCNVCRRRSHAHDRVSAWENLGPWSRHTPCARGLRKPYGEEASAD